MSADDARQQSYLAPSSSSDYFIDPRRGRPPLKRHAAAKWLSEQPQLLAIASPDMFYRNGRWGPVSREWRVIARAVKGEGFFSQKTGVCDVPVREIVNEALSIRGK